MEFAEKKHPALRKWGNCPAEMQAQRERTGSLFSCISIEERITAIHPLRRIRRLADHDLDRLNPTFCELYASEGRPSVPPEQFLLASLLQAFYGIRSERPLNEQSMGRFLVKLGLPWFGGQVNRRIATTTRMFIDNQPKPGQPQFNDDFLNTELFTTAPEAQLLADRWPSRELSAGHRVN